LVYIIHNANANLNSISNISLSDGRNRFNRFFTNDDFIDSLNNWPITIRKSFS